MEYWRGLEPHHSTTPSLHYSSPDEALWDLEPVVYARFARAKAAALVPARRPNTAPFIKPDPPG